jgi:DNA (cytosine-5)-methyltransferase 1
MSAPITFWSNGGYVHGRREASLAATHGSPSRLTHLDLFSGIGGFAIAAKRAGFQTIGFSEIEQYACKILKKHWPDVQNYGDIRNVRNVRAYLVTGGFPCQPFSYSGKRRGKEDDRHLWPEMLRVISESRPRWVLGENVPGIINLELDNLLSDLEAINYSAWPIVIPACALDARHRRDRVWIVAHDMRCISSSEQKRECAMLGRTQNALADGEAQFMAGPPAKQGVRWPSESILDRVAHGLPNLPHRMKALGNSIVPQVAETLMRMMASMENNRINDQ